MDFNILSKKNAKPEKRCELRLALNAGSMLENDDQQGLAHFVEHMCFNGTKNFAKSALVDFLESAGVKFGAHLNAYTSFDETVYMLQLPTDKEEIFQKGFQVLEDWAHNVSFDAAEIDKERGVVISERRGRLGAGERMRQQWWPAVFGGSRYADRLPIGTLPVLEGFKHETLKEYYSNWYRPELMAVCAVGDFDVDKVEALIKAKFSNLVNKPNAPKRQSYDVPDHKGLRVAIASDAEAAQTTIQLNYKHPLSIATTQEDLRKGMVGELFNSMLGTRLDELIQKGGTPFTYAFSFYGNNVRTKNGFQSFAMVNEKSILEGLRLLLIENQRVKRHGFNAGEFDRAKKDMMVGMEKAFKERDKTESNRYVMALVNSYLENEPFSDVEFRLNFYKKYLDGITLAEVNALGKKWITEKGDNGSCVIQAPRKDSLKLPTEAEIVKVFEDVESLKIDPLKEEAVATSMMKTTPKAGKIASEKKIAEFGITEWTLSNGAKVVFKPTTFKNDEVLMSAFSPGGFTMYPVSDNDNGSFGTFGISQSGLGDLDPVAFQRYMTGKIARVSPYVSELFEGMNGSYSPKDEETAMQMLYLWFTQPRKDEKMFQTALKQQRGFFENMSKSPEAAFRDSVLVTLYNNHPRRQPMKPERLDKIDYNRAFQMYQERFADAGDFTFFFIGNIDEAKFKPMVETYIASLPTKNRKETWTDPKAEPLSTPVAKNITRGIEPKSTVQLTYMNDFTYNRRSLFEMTALVKLLDIKLREKIREEKGGSYGVQVSPSPSKYPKERFQLTISFGCAPEKAQELTEAALKEVADVLAMGSDDKNLVKIKETFTREREVDLKENRFWSGYLASSYQNQLDIADLSKYNEWVNTLTGEDLKKIANKFLKDAKLMQFSLKPETRP